MENVKDSNYVELLNSISSEIDFKIINLLVNRPNGLNLTDTANVINEKTSTVRDHLNSLLESKIIYRKEKLYFLSNYGNYVFYNLQKMEEFHKTKEIFGKLSFDVIPAHFLYDLAKDISDVELYSGKWQFMAESNRIFKIIKNSIGKIDNDLRIIGWSGLDLSMSILKNYFPEINPQQLIKHSNFQLISDKTLLDEIKQKKKIKEIIDETDFVKRTFIWEGEKDFQFTLFKYNSIIQLFLNEEDDSTGHYLVLEDKLSFIKFFDDLFNYYMENARPLSGFI